MLCRESLITPLLSLETSLLVALLLKLLQYLHLLLQSDVGSSYIHHLYCHSDQTCVHGQAMPKRSIKALLSSHVPQIH